MTDVKIEVKTIDSHGLKPDAPFWKLYQIDGFQLLVFWQENEDEEGKWDLVLSTSVEEWGELQAKVIVNNEAFVRKTFEGYDDEKARSGLQFLFDNVIKAMEGGDDFELKTPGWIIELKRG